MTHTAVLFDMNGILVDDEPLQEAAFRQVLEPLGLHLSHEEYMSYFIGKTDKEGLEDYAVATHRHFDTADLIAAKGAAYQDLTRTGVAGYEGVQAFVRALAAAGARLAVVTSSLQVEAATVLKGLGLDKYFPVVVAAEAITNGKPDPEGFLKAAQALSVKPASCVVVEDAPSGIRAGKAAGMFVLAVTNTHRAKDLTGANLLVDAVSAALVNQL